MHYTHLGPGDSATWGPIWSPNDPRFDDYEPPTMSESDARDIAIDEIVAVPSTLATILNDESSNSCEVVHTHLIHIEDIADASIPELLVLLISGTAEQALQARWELRERILADQADDIKRRTAELMMQPVFHHEEF
jgi:hypothetical protein